MRLPGDPETFAAGVFVCRKGCEEYHTTGQSIFLDTFLNVTYKAVCLVLVSTVDCALPEVLACSCLCSRKGFVVWSVVGQEPLAIMRMEISIILGRCSDPNVLMCKDILAPFIHDRNTSENSLKHD